MEDQGPEEARGRFVVVGLDPVPEVLSRLPGVEILVVRDPAGLISCLERSTVQGLVIVSSEEAVALPELDEVRALDACYPLVLAGDPQAGNPVDFEHGGSFDGYVDLNWSPKFIAAQLWAAVERVQSGRNMVAIQGTLLEALSETQRELVEAREASQASAAAKSRFLATVSHEIRTPLNGIIGMTLLALDGELGDEEREHVRLAHESGQSLLGIINDILDISKLESGKMTLERTTFDLKRTLASALAPLGITARGKELRLHAFLAREVPRFVVGDGLRIKQIVTNLVGNAIKFSSSGDVSVRVDPEPAAGPDFVHIQVRDNGIGIPAKRVEHVFDRFSQADDSTTRKFGGTGLGLAICRELAEMMNGRVWAESEVGRGSVFHVTLELPASATADLPESYPSCLDGKHVLIASPSAFLEGCLTEVLRAAGAEVQTAATSAETALAFERCRSAGSSPHWLMVDTGVPGEDGEPLELGVLGAFAESRTQVLELATPGAFRRSQAGFEHQRLEGPFFADELLSLIVGVDPRTQSGPAIDTAPARLEPSQGRGLRLLVAEDNVVNQKVAARLLERAGHAVTIVGDGEQALEAVARSHFDLVLMDIHMPVMDGLTAVSRLRDNEKRTGSRRMPVIALTAASGEELQTTISQADFDAVLGKPVDPRRLQEILSGVTPSSALGET